MTVERWISEMWPRRKWSEHDRFSGARRLQLAFQQTTNATNQWPTVNEILSQVPTH
jgi:hypothetical protein